MMEFHQLGFIPTLICLALLACQHVQASPAESYWQSMWPETPMPNALRALTQPGGKIQAKVSDNKIDLDVYGEANKENEPTRLKFHELNTFFFEQDLYPGKNLKVEFTKRSDEFTFSPNTVAESTVFSTDKFPEILNQFNIEAESAEAKKVKYTLEICEKPAISGEDKYCATSLESLVSFTVSKLGKNIRVLSTEMEKETKQQRYYYRVEEGVKKVGDKAVACHKLNYPYAVFYCHKVATRAYVVPLVATNDGTKAKGLAVCHTNTIKWSRKNLAFQQLNVKPGTVPVCHFLATDTLLWVPN